VRPTFVGALLGVVPEADLASLGVRASGLLRMWPPDQMAEVHRLMRREYGAMRRDPTFASVGNVAANGFLVRSGRHFFRCLPRAYTPDRTWPLLVFLHGSSGNLVLYSWLWSRFADGRGFVVLCPTWDNGRWEEREGTQFALDALDDTLRSCAIDETRVFLAGQSAGAVGGWAVLRARPEAFRGFVCISGGRGPGWESPKVRSIPVLLIHGGEDQAIPVGAARGLHKALLGAGRAAEFVEFPDEDHFLLLRSSAAVHGTMRAWMVRHLSEPRSETKQDETEEQLSRSPSR
jgi:poly(3-hydroxybutyrate) depolymerase